jgi:hypothetical protein
MTLFEFLHFFLVLFHVFFDLALFPVLSQERIEFKRFGSMEEQPNAPCKQGDEMFPSPKIIVPKKNINQDEGVDHDING